MPKAELKKIGDKFACQYNFEHKLISEVPFTIQVACQRCGYQFKTAHAVGAVHREYDHLDEKHPDG